MGCLFVDAYAGLIPGWGCSLRKDIGFVERALRYAVAFRARQGHAFDDAIHHSDAGSTPRLSCPGSLLITISSALLGAPGCWDNAQAESF